MSTTHDLECAMSTDKLSVFRELVGVTDTLSLGPVSVKRSAKNIGIYQRVVSAEKNARIQYYAFAFLINSCLLLQIVFAAVVTALGAANGSHAAITGVGAANTVIAGLLSFTKGQGLPNRLQQYQNTLRKVREYIEQRERDFARLDCKLDLDDEIKTIVEKYENARENDEANDPGAYRNLPDTAAKANIIQQGVTEKPAAQIPEKIMSALEKPVAQTEANHGKTDESRSSNIARKDVRDLRIGN